MHGRSFPGVLLARVSHCAEVGAAETDVPALAGTVASASPMTAAQKSTSTSGSRSLLRRRGIRPIPSSRGTLPCVTATADLDVWLLRSSDTSRLVLGDDRFG